MLGNNMFAYCINNPATCMDPTGTLCVFAFMGDYRTQSILTTGGGGGCGGISGYGGSGGSGYKDIIDELSDITDKALDAVGAVAEDCWDAYMRGYNLQQETQMQETQMMINAAMDVYSYLDETGTISFAMVCVNSVNAARSFQIAAVYLAAPIPTPIDEAFAIGYVLKGLYHLYGVEKAFYK